MDVTADFSQTDPFNFHSQLSSEELQTVEAATTFAESVLVPAVTTAFREEYFDPVILKKMGQAGFLGGSIDATFGGPGMNAVQYGLLAREFERVDSGYRTVLSVTSGLVMQAIMAFGSDQQKQDYLPRLARGECVASFGLTEPEHGSDPAGMETTATTVDGGYRLNGHKRWIGLASSAALLVVWAKDDTGDIRGFLVDLPTEGIAIQDIAGKYALRVVPSGDVVLNDVFVPKTSVLPNSKGMKSVYHCLNHARFSIAWGVVGAAESCYETALTHAQSREQFGKTLASQQLVQAKLVTMLTDIAFMLQSCLRVSRLIDAAAASPVLISILKRECVLKAMGIAHAARDILGGNGITDTTPIIRHLMNLEAVNTYEGAYDIHTLIIGRAITGVAAF